MKRTIIIAALVGLALSGGAILAQTFLNPVQVADFKSNGTAIGFFHHSPLMYYLNFKGTKYNNSSRTLDVCVNCATQDPDMGVVESPNGIQLGTVQVKPTCDVTHRGQMWTQENSATGDAGVTDTTYQCLKAANGTYAWISVTNGG